MRFTPQIASLCCLVPTIVMAADFPRPKSFGRLPDGRETYLYTLRNESGFQVEIADYGGTIVRLLAPDRKGAMADVVLGFSSIEPYPKNSPYFGALIGRVGNRFADG